MIELESLDRAMADLEADRAAYNRSVDKLQAEIKRVAQTARAIARNRKLEAQQIAELLDVSRMTAYRWGATHCEDYADLIDWAQANKPEKLDKIEYRFKKLLKEDRYAS